MNEPYCDPEDGTCEPAGIEASESKKQSQSDLKIIYVGDPMCSWCYGMAPELMKLKAKYDDIPFQTIVGGLRPGGGDPWDEQMKDFLAHHWKQVEERSGQQFGYKLFDRQEFNYDTEPSCRAVVTSRKWLKDADLDFFEAIQVKFYKDSEDPTTDEFYKSICEEFEIPYTEFLKEFHSDKMKELTNAEFQLNRSWGISGYPTVVLQKEEKLYAIARGYSVLENMEPLIEQIRTLEISELK